MTKKEVENVIAERDAFKGENAHLKKNVIPNWHIHKTRKNCFTCDNFYINHKGLPCCKIGQCGMMVKHKPRINDDYELEQPCDIVGRYFGISMSNEEAEKFINNCKIFYENEFC